MAAIFVLALLTACGEIQAPKESAPPSNPVTTEPVPEPAPAVKTGSIAGQIKFKGTLPAPKKFKVSKDVGVCGTEQESEELVVDPESRGIRWAVAWVDPPEPVTNITVVQEVVLDQRGCRFQPHVLLVRAGDEVKVLNPDGVLHNFHTYSVENPPVNKAQPAFRNEMRVHFGKPERFRVGCDAHGWMAGWIVVTGHPYYAVTERDGSFVIKDFPAGKHVLRVWHETMGEMYAEVVVKPGETTFVTHEWELQSSKTSWAVKQRGGSSRAAF